MDTVLRELYRTDGFPETPRPPRPDGKILRSSGNVHKPQYYTQTLKSPATVVHIITSAEFWDTSDVPFSDWDPDTEKLRTSHTGQFAYTTGILWCNSSPDWSWRSKGSDTIIRCRIDLPAGTQVVVDRSPVYGGYSCEFDEAGSRSRFPDVLLLPGEFYIQDVKRYKREDYDSDYDGDSIESLDSEQFVSRIMEDAQNFLDVRLQVTRMMRVPALSADGVVGGGV